jgi:hypothetical protein
MRGQNQGMFLFLGGHSFLSVLALESFATMERVPTMVRWQWQPS